MVVGVPILHTAHLAESLRSLAGQTWGDLVFVVVDDSPDGSAGAVAAAVLGQEAPGRFHIERSLEPRGLVGAWQRCLELARLHHPDARLFAWASDHDRWNPRFVQELVAALDARPEAVLAYPLVERSDAPGAAPWRFDTAGDRLPLRRLMRVTRRMRAGDMVYGLFRTGALEEAQGLLPVLLPDRLLLARLALRGEFVQVPELLWHRRVAAQSEPTLVRQRRRLLAGAPPRWSRVPWQLAHAALLAGSPGTPRPRALLAGVVYGLLSYLFPLARRLAVLGAGRDARVPPAA